MGEKRKTPRVPILTQVEAQGETGTALGRARDISVGGVLIETPETLTEGATVIIRFFIPPERKPIQAAGRVVRVEAGKSMGIAFLGLRRADEERVLEHVKKIQKTPSELLPSVGEGATAKVRRSARVYRRMPVLLGWQDEGGRPQQEAAETQWLSKYGAMVHTFTELQPGQLLRLTVADSEKRGVGRVVWVRQAQVAGRIEVGLELLGTDDFWGMEFPPYRPHPPEGVERRRSPRLPRRVPVVLHWTDELGREREETTETRLLSRHGALIHTSAKFSLSHRLRVCAPEINREAEAEVICVLASDRPDRTDVAVDFVDTEDFWGLPFSPDRNASADEQ